MNAEEENRRLRELLAEMMFCTANRKEFDRHGYSCLVREESAIRDINYRNAPLFETPEEAINDAIKNP